MDDRDPSLIGAHCRYAACGQLDFLPFTCDSCRATFCLEHRSESAHRCPQAGEWGARRRALAQSPAPRVGAPPPLLQAAVEERCAAPKCRTVIGTSLSTSVRCAACRRNYCLKHRLCEEHDCADRGPAAAAGVGVFDHPAKQVRGALARLKAWGAERKTTATATASKSTSASSTAARLTAVNLLKKTAKGDDKLPSQNRIHLYVEAEAASITSKFPNGAFFYSRNWVIGRLLDAAAKSLQVENLNNQGSDERNKLRVFHVEGGRLLEFHEKVGQVLVSGNKIVLLRGVGPSVPDLLDLT